LFSFSDDTRQPPKRDAIVTRGPTDGHGLQLAVDRESAKSSVRPNQAVTRAF
jgi:hypothetical protein